MNRLSDMQAFVNVLQTGSFAAASRRLHLSKSVVTKRVNQLESMLGVQLLRRSTRRLSVTDAGATYYERCMRILSDVEDAEAEVSSMQLQPRGHLRISCSSAIGVGFLARDLCEFQQQYSDLSIELIHNDRAVNPIHENYDLCFQVLDLTAEMVAKKPITSLRVVLCATPAYLDKHGTPQGPAELAQHRCAHNIYLEPKIEWHLKTNDETTIVSIDPFIRTNNVWMMRDAVRNGNCIAPLPAFLVEAELTEKTLVPILTDYALDSFWMTAYYPRLEHVPAKTQLFLDYVIERYGTTLPWEERLASLSV